MNEAFTATRAAFMVRIATFSLVIGVMLAAGPAAAQFGNIFGNNPPVPPADVPNGSFPQQPPSPQDPADYPGQSQTPYPSQSPYQGQSSYQGESPYPGGSPYQGGSSYQGGSAYPGQPPYPGQPAYQGRVPPAYPAAPQQPQPTIQAQPIPPPAGATVEPQNPAQNSPQPPAAGGQRAVVAPPPAGPAAPAANPQGAPAPAAEANEDVVVERPTAHIENQRAIFLGLDKITGRTIKFDAAIGETVQFGALQVTPRACYTRPPTEATNTDAFVEVDEVTLKGEIKRIFTGWMFASSPGLNAVEHPTYDVWLTGCSGPIETSQAEPAADANAAPAHPRRTATH
jgi:hypothetical protein